MLTWPLFALQVHAGTHWTYGEHDVNSCHSPQTVQRHYMQPQDAYYITKLYEQQRYTQLEPPCPCLDAGAFQATDCLTAGWT